MVGVLKTVLYEIIFLDFNGITQGNILNDIFRPGLKKACSKNALPQTTDLAFTGDMNGTKESWCKPEMR